MSEVTDRQVNKASKKLKQAFSAYNNDQMFQAEFDKVIEAIMETKKGKEMLVQLSSLDYTFAFETGNFAGFCDSENKKIVLNPGKDLDALMPTLVHEARHAVQASEVSLPKREQMTVASCLRHRRAIEADAVAHEMAFIYDAKDKYPEMYKKESGSPMFQAYEKEMQASGDEKKAMKASFEAWYSYGPYQKFYDKDHKQDIQTFCQKGKKEQDILLFSQEVGAFQTMQACTLNGSSYISEDFLTSVETSSIPEQDKQEIMRMMEDYARTTGGAFDKSVLTMPTRPGTENQGGNEQDGNEEDGNEEGGNEEGGNDPLTFENPDVVKASTTKPFNFLEVFEQTKRAKLKLDYQCEEANRNKKLPEAPFSRFEKVENNSQDRPPRIDVKLNTGSGISIRPDKILLDTKSSKDKGTMFNDCMSTVRLLQEQGWTAMRVKGSKEMQEQTYLAARALGMPMVDFVPSKELQEKGDLIAKEHAQTRHHSKSVDERFPLLEDLREKEKKSKIDKAFIKKTEKEGLGYVPPKPTEQRDKKAPSQEGQKKSAAETLKTQGLSPSERLKAQSDKRHALKQSEMTQTQAPQKAVQQAVVNKKLQSR